MCEMDIIKSQINDIINTHNKYKNCYFWHPPQTASQRRQQEFLNEYSFQIENDFISVIQELNVSCRNYYYSLLIYVNNVKKDIRALKKLL